MNPSGYSSEVIKSSEEQSRHRKRTLLFKKSYFMHHSTFHDFRCCWTNWLDTKYERCVTRNTWITFEVLRLELFEPQMIYHVDGVKCTFIFSAPIQKWKEKHPLRGCAFLVYLLIYDSSCDFLILSGWKFLWTFHHKFFESTEKDLRVVILNAYTQGNLS